MTFEEWRNAVADLEARAVLAERAGLPRTARGWRERVANLSVAVVPPPCGEGGRTSRT